MKYLLDTHIWIWSILEPNRLSAMAIEVLKNQSNTFFLSPISIWETLILIEKGRLEVDQNGQKWVQYALKQSPVQDIPLNRDVALKSRAVDLPHQDPADRIIAATAWEFDLTLITVDHHLLKSKQIKLL